MSTRSKTALIILVTFLIGMLVGSLITTHVTLYQFQKRAFRMRTPNGFIERLEMIIQPDDSQKEAVRKVLLKHFEQVAEMRDGMPALIDSLHKDLDPILTEEQKQRLKTEFVPRGRRFMPPPGTMPPWKDDRQLPPPNPPQR